MKKRITFLLLIALLLVLLVLKNQHISSSPGPKNEQETKFQPFAIKPPLPPEIEAVVNEYDRWLTREIKNSGTVGAAVAVVYKDRVALLKNFGVKKAGTCDSIDKHTIFRLASVSKTITGVLAGILENEQTLRLDDKVLDYLPGFRLKSPESTSGLTIRNLLSHTSGLVPHAYDNMVEGKVPVRKIMQVLDEVDLSARPGEIYSYQNVMFSLIDTILTVKTSKNFGEQVREKVFLPFGMNDASTDFHSFQSSDNKAFPHVRGKGKYWPLRLNDRYYSTAPAAGVNASISDMARFLQALLKNEPAGVDKKIRQTIFTPQVISPLSRRYLNHWEGVNSKQYAIGWRIIGYKGRKIAYHGGYVQGYKAEIALCEKEHTGIVYLTNAPNKTASKTVPRFLDILFETKDQRKLLTQKPERSDPPTNS